MISSKKVVLYGLGGLFGLWLLVVLSFGICFAVAAKDGWIHLHGKNDFGNYSLQVEKAVHQDGCYRLPIVVELHDDAKLMITDALKEQGIEADVSYIVLDTEFKRSLASYRLRGTSFLNTNKNVIMSETLSIEWMPIQNLIATIYKY